MENQFAKSQGNNSINFGPLFIGLAAIMWSLDFFSRGYLVETANMDPSLIVMYEHIIISLIMVPFLAKSFNLFNKFDGKEWISIVLIGGGASALATVALTEGYALGFLAYGPVVALTQQIQPVVAIGLAHLLLKESLPEYYYPLSLLAIGGVVLMYLPTIRLFNANQILLQTGLLAAFLGLTAATLWGTGTVLGKYLLVHSETDIEYLEIANLRFAIGMVVLIIYNIAFAPLVKSFQLFADPFVIINLLFIALIPGLLSLILYYYGLKSTHASVATLFELAFPLSFLVLVPAVFGTRVIVPIQYVGAVILIIATTLLSYKYGKQTEPEQFEDIQGIVEH